jgi:hypothetical protein
MKKYLFLFTLLSTFANGQIIIFTDVVFKTRLLNANTSNTIAKNSQGNYFKIDANNNSEIEVSEALEVFELRVERPQNSSNYINTLSGIEYFTNLRLLSCGNNNIPNINLQNLTQLVTLQLTNNLLTTIDVTNLTNLKELFVRNNILTSLVFLNNNDLENIWISYNDLVSLDLTSIPSLKFVYVDNNELTNLNITGLNNLTELNCNNNSISTLDLTNKPLLSWMDVSENNLLNINLNGLTNLNIVTINNTLISTFDGSNCGVKKLICQNNPNLTSINVKNNYYSNSVPDMLDFAFQISNNPLLQSICVDSGEQNNLAFCNYNTSGNVQVYGGSNCDVPLQVMSSESFKNNELTLFPNPVKNELNFSFEKTVHIEKINIYNTLGQLVKQFIGNQNSINLSDLNTGYYHIEFISEDGKLTKKFIKE